MLGRVEQMFATVYANDKRIRCGIYIKTSEYEREINVYCQYDRTYDYSSVPVEFQMLFSEISEEIFCFLKEYGFSRLDLLLHTYEIKTKPKWITLKG